MVILKKKVILRRRGDRGRLPTSREALKLTGELEDGWHLYAVTGSSKCTKDS